MTGETGVFVVGAVVVASVPSVVVSTGTLSVSLQNALTHTGLANVSSQV